MSDIVVGTAEPIESLAGRRRRRVPVLIAVAIAIAVAVVVCAIGGGALAPYDPDAQDLALGATGASWSHPFGTDELGRDVLSRVMAGARTAVVGPFVIALGAMLIGSLLGTFSGYRRGLADGIIMRWVDLMLALPSLLVAIVVVGVLGGGYWTAVLLLLVLTAPYDTRLIRAATLEQRPRPYVEAGRTLGLPSTKIMYRHIWPNLVAVITANSFLTFAFSIVGLSALSFLGLGVGPGTADWGRMIADTRGELFTHPIVPIAPALVLVATAASVNLIGDWLYELLSDRGRAR